jgi:hypothetical protein
VIASGVVKGVVHMLSQCVVLTVVQWERTSLHTAVTYVLPTCTAHHHALSHPVNLLFEVLVLVPTVCCTVYSGGPA